MSQTTAPLPDSDALEAELARLRAEVEALRARAEAAEAAADHDVLTPALNRRGFVTALHRAMAYCKRHQVPAVLLYLDLDGFKAVNDGRGHNAGDMLLKIVAQRLKGCIRKSDLAARIGGVRLIDNRLLGEEALSPAAQPASAVAEA